MTMMSGQVVEARIRIEAKPAKIYQAFTTEQRLEAWFAEHASVSIPDQHYAFWGRHTLGTPAGGLPGMIVLDATPDRSLSFTWPLDGTESIVTIQIDPDGDDSNLHLEHHNLSGAMPWLVEAFWSISLENLRAYIEQGEPGLRFDFASIPYGDVAIEAEINADPDDVFAALIDPSQLDRYMADAPAKIDPRVGGSYDLGWSDEGPVQILELESGERLSYSWRSGKPDIADTVVTWELEANAGRTRLDAGSQWLRARSPRIGLRARLARLPEPDQADG